MHFKCSIGFHSYQNVETLETKSFLGESYKELSPTGIQICSRCKCTRSKIPGNKGFINGKRKEILFTKIKEESGKLILSDKAVSSKPMGFGRQ